MDTRTLRHANREMPPLRTAQMEKIIDSMFFLQQEVLNEHKFLNDLVKKLRNIDQQDHLYLKSTKS